MPRRPSILAAAIVFLVVVCSGVTAAYVIQTVTTFRGTRQLSHPVSTSSPAVLYWMDVDSFPFPADDVERIIRDSFAAWQDVETSFVTFEEQGTGSFQGSRSDGRNVIMYDSDGFDLQIPSGTGIIAITRTYWDGSGRISEADIIFNGQEIDFSVSANSTRRGQVDLQSTMTHEIGHLLGLDHSALIGPSTRRPTMNPFNDANAPREGRTLETDDRAGISVLYPSTVFSSLSTLAGEVVHPGGEGAFGVHVVAYEANTSTFAVSTLTGATSDGVFEIGGLPPGDYQLRIEPLNGVVDYESFGGVYNAPFDTDFSPEYYDNATSSSDAPTISVVAGERLDGFDFILGPDGTLPPALSAVDLPVNTPDVTGPYPAVVRAVDDGEVGSVVLTFRVDGGREVSVQMRRDGNDYVGQIPGQPAGTVTTYNITATDDEGQTTRLPLAGELRFETIAFSGAPVLYAAVRSDDAVVVIDTGLNREVARVAVGETPLSVELSRDGNLLFVANSGADEGGDGDGVWVIDTGTHRVVEKIETGAGPLDLDLSADGRTLYVTNSREGSVSVIDALTRTLVRTHTGITFSAGPYGVADSPDGRLFVTDLNGDAVLEVDAITGSVLSSIPVVTSPRDIAVSPGGDRLYVSGFGGGVSVLAAGTATVAATLTTDPVERVFRVAVSPTGNLVYATDPVGARLLVFGEGELIDVVSGPNGAENARDVVVSDDGRRIYVSYQDSDEIATFDAETMTLVSVLAVDGGPRGIALRSDPFGSAFDVEIVSRSDFDGSGDVAFSDFLLFAAAFGLDSSDSAFDARFDLDDDRAIGFADFLLFASAFGVSAGM